MINNNFDLEDLPDEKWVDVPDYVGFYQVSTAGRVRSLKRYKRCSRSEHTTSVVQPRILKPTTVFMLCKEGSTKIVTLNSILKKVSFNNE